MLAYVLLVASIGIPGAGSSFPGRFLVVVAPLAAVPLAVVIARVRLARVAYLALMGLSVALAGLGIARPHLLYTPIEAGHTNLPVLRSLQPIFPNTLQKSAAKESAAGSSPGLVLYGTATVRGGSYEPPSTLKRGIRERARRWLASR